MRTGWILGFGGAALLAVACGVNEDLFRGEDDPVPPGTGTTSGTSTAVGGSGGATTTTGTPAGTAGAGGTATGTPTGTGGTGGTGPAREIPCTNETCIGGQVCCVSYEGAAQDHCGPPGSCGDQAAEASCDGPDDCPGGEICCGRYVPGGSGSGYYTEVSCSPTCEDDGTSLGVVLCEAPADCESNLCIPSQWLPQGFNYCE